jgi:hypothetical protein
MRRLMMFAAAVATALGIGSSASAQGVGVEVYVGPPTSYYYGPTPYAVYDDYDASAYSYYAPGITVYRRRGIDPSPNNTGAYFRKLDRENRGGNSN